MESDVTWSRAALNCLERTVDRLGLGVDVTERLRRTAESKASEEGKTLVGLTSLNEAMAGVLGDLAAVDIPDSWMGASSRPLEHYDIRIGVDQIDRLEGWLNEMRIDVEGMRDGDPIARQLIEQKLLGAMGALSVLGLTPKLGGDADGIYAGSIYVDLPGNRPEEMTASEAAAYLGVSDARVRQLLAEDPPRLAGRKAGGVWVISRESLEAYKNSRS